MATTDPISTPNEPKKGLQGTRPAKVDPAYMSGRAPAKPKMRTINLGSEMVGVLESNSELIEAFASLTYEQREMLGNFIKTSSYGPDETAKMLRDGALLLAQQNQVKARGQTILQRQQDQINIMNQQVQEQARRGKLLRDLRKAFPDQVAEAERALGSLPTASGRTPEVDALLQFLEGNPELAEGTLERLIWHNNPEIRVAVARHPSATQRILAVMAFDDGPGVRGAVVQRTTDPKVLRYLLTDPDGTVRFLAFRQSRFDEEVVNGLALEVEALEKSVGGRFLARMSLGRSVLDGLEKDLARTAEPRFAAILEAERRSEFKEKIEKAVDESTRTAVSVVSEYEAAGRLMAEGFVDALKKAKTDAARAALESILKDGSGSEKKPDDPEPDTDWDTRGRRRMRE